MKSVERGVFIVFEGFDGSGKTTQLEKARAFLAERGREVVVTREPGGTAIGEKIRGLLLDTANGDMCDGCELLLYAASRAQHVAEIIAPALAEGKAVLCDRFGLSTAAYQGYGRGLDLERIAAVHRAAAGGVEPDLTLVIDVPAEVGAERVGGRRGEGKDRLEREEIEFFERVRRGYLTEAEGDGTVAVIDGRGDADGIFDAVRAALEAVL